MKNHVRPEDRLRPEQARRLWEIMTGTKVLSMGLVQIGDEPWGAEPIRLNGIRRSRRFGRLEVVR